MNSKCVGCGIKLQNSDNKKLGYTSNLESKYCERCFRINNYNEYKIVDKSIINFDSIINEINETNNLVVFVIDIFSISNEVIKLANKIKNDILLVISKRDIFSYKINDIKFINSIKINCVDKIVVSSNKNYNLDLLFDKIKKYKKGSDVYFVGLTNTGKSTLINKIIYNYTDINTTITTSMLPSTTLDTIKIKIDDNFNLIDTPGIVDDSNICNYVDNKMLKKIFPKKEIKPITYQLKKGQYITIEDLIVIEIIEDCNLTLYFSNQLKIDRLYKKIDNNLKLNEIKCLNNQDIVINGIGFVNTKNSININIYTKENVLVYTRDELI